LTPAIHVRQVSHDSNISYRYCFFVAGKLIYKENKRCKRGFQMSLKLNNKLRIAMLSCAAVVVTSGAAYAASTPELSQTIDAGTISTDILDGSRDSVASPGVTMGAQNFSFDCQTSTGTLGSASERIYVINPDDAANWDLTVGATGGGTTTWSDGGSSTYAFNDASGSPAGCDDGQLTLDPSSGTASLTTDCVVATCNTTGISQGAQASFTGSTEVTLLSASGAQTLWRGYLTGIEASQTIPPETSAGTYTIDLTLTVASS
jgi:hypothetical protein